VKVQAYHWLFPSALLLTVNACYGWGGLALLEDIGPIAEQSARREGALTWTYMQGGRWLLDVTGMADGARQQAESMFGELRPQLLARPALAMDLLHDHALGGGHRILLWSHWGAPLLWFAALFSFARRQKAVVTTRRVR
jgi:hypothetical protein